MHQPLHTVSRFAEDFPRGDMGGNLFMIDGKDNITELHALWDSTVYEWDQDIPQPLSEQSWELLGNISKIVRDDHPWASADMQGLLGKPEKEWASEGYQDAINVVYKLKQGEVPSDEYVKVG